MTRVVALMLFLLLIPSGLRCADTSISLSEHLKTSKDLAELRDIQADWHQGVLRLCVSTAERHAWVVIPAPKGGWGLRERATVNAEITNTGNHSVGVMFWVVGNNGWDAVLGEATLAPHETRRFSCHLRSTFPGDTKAQAEHYQTGAGHAFRADKSRLQIQGSKDGPAETQSAYHQSGVTRTA